MSIKCECGCPWKREEDTGSPREWVLWVTVSSEGAWN